VTARETASLVCVLTFPQLFLQVFGAAYYDRDLVPQYDAAELSGRVVCSQSGKWLLYVGIGLATVMYATAVCVAWIARVLPSALNETPQVFRAAAFVSVLSLIIIPLMLLFDVPSKGPNLVVGYG
jgi:hypothetical protein